MDLKAISPKKLVSKGLGSLFGGGGASGQTAQNAEAKKSDADHSAAIRAQMAAEKVKAAAQMEATAAKLRAESQADKVTISPPEDNRTARPKELSKFVQSIFN